MRVAGQPSRLLSTLRWCTTARDRTVSLESAQRETRLGERVSDGAEGDRTPDLPDAIRTLSQLSYGPR